VDNPHKSTKSTKSKDLNPKVYPDWWGEETSPKQQFKCPKRLKSADPAKA